MGPLGVPVFKDVQPGVHKEHKAAHDKVSSRIMLYVFELETLRPCASPRIKRQPYVY